jgi:hypothetical protein
MTIAIRLLRVALVVLLLGTVLAQVFVPVFASQVGTTFPEVASMSSRPALRSPRF